MREAETQKRQEPGEREQEGEPRFSGPALHWPLWISATLRGPWVSSAFAMFPRLLSTHNPHIQMELFKSKDTLLLMSDLESHCALKRPLGGRALGREPRAPEAGRGLAGIRVPLECLLCKNVAHLILTTTQRDAA